MAKTNAKAITNSIEKWLWWYHAHGISTIPLGVNKRNNLKAPSLDAWEEYHKRLPTTEELKQWIKDGLFKNIGIILGHVSDDIVVIDIDDETIPELIGLDFDKIKASGSWIVKTGKGYHIYNKHHSDPGAIQRPLKYKIEYRSNRGYVVAPPSIHPNGKTYTFMGITNPDDLPELVMKNVKSIFGEMKTKIGKAWNITAKKSIRAGTPQNDGETHGYPKCVETALNTITKPPMRYYTIYGIVSSFVRNNIPKDMAMKRIKQFNLEKCVPPHENSIVEQAVNGAYKPGAKLYGCEFWIDDAEMCPYEDITECPYGSKRTKRQLLEKYSIYETKVDNKTGEIVRTGRINAPRLAKLLMNGDGGIYATLKDNQEIIRYNGQTYQKTAKSYIEGRINYYLGDDTTEHLKKEIISFIQGENLIDRDALDGNKTLLPLENGILDMVNRELIGYSPEYYFTHFLPVSYDKKAKIKKIKTFIDEILPVEYIPVLQQFLGDCLTTDYRYKKAVLCAGPRNTGKSTLLNLMGALIGEDNISHASLYELCVGQYSSAELYNKRANICAQTESNNLTKVNKFLSLTGMDHITAREIYQAPFSFVNFAKLIFSCNKIPTTDLTGEIAKAYYIRWLVFPFENIFEGTVRDVNMLTKMIDDKQEMSGFLNWALEGLDSLEKNKGYFEVMSMEDTKEFMEKGTNPIRDFVDTRIVVSTGREWVTDMYKHYVQFCKENNYPYINDVWFTRKAFPLLPMSAGKGHTKNRNYWKGIKYISPTEENRGQKSL